MQFIWKGHRDRNRYKNRLGKNERRLLSECIQREREREGEFFDFNIPSTAQVTSI